MVLMMHSAMCQLYLRSYVNWQIQYFGLITHVILIAPPFSKIHSNGTTHHFQRLMIAIGRTNGTCRKFGPPQQ